MARAERGCVAEMDPEDHRVQVRSKKEVIEQVNRYKKLLRTVLDGQEEVEAETKRVLLQELLAVGHFCAAPSLVLSM